MQSTSGTTTKTKPIRKERPDDDQRETKTEKKERRPRKERETSVDSVRGGASKLVESMSKQTPSKVGIRRMESIEIPSRLVLSTPALPPGITTTQQLGDTPTRQAHGLKKAARHEIENRNERFLDRLVEKSKGNSGKEKPGSSSSSQISTTSESPDVRLDETPLEVAPCEKAIPPLRLFDLPKRPATYGLDQGDMADVSEHIFRRRPGERDDAAIQAFRRQQTKQSESILSLYGNDELEREKLAPGIRKSLAALSSKELKALNPSEGEIRQVYRYYADKKLVPTTTLKLTSRLETNRALALPHDERLALTRKEFKTYFSHSEEYKASDALRNGSPSLSIAASALTEWSQATAAKIVGSIDRALSGRAFTKKTDAELFDKVMTKMLGGLDEKAMKAQIIGAMPAEFCELFATAHAELEQHFGPAIEPRPTDDKAIEHMKQRARQVNILNLNFLGLRSLTATLMQMIGTWSPEKYKKGQAVVQAITAAINGASGFKTTEGRLNIDPAQNRKWHVAFSEFAERVCAHGQESLDRGVFISLESKSSLSH